MDDGLFNRLRQYPYVTMPSTLAITIVAMTATMRMKTISADMVTMDALTSAPSAIPS